jgi:hypothetical protein
MVDGSPLKNIQSLDSAATAVFAMVNAIPNVTPLKSTMFLDTNVLNFFYICYATLLYEPHMEDVSERYKILHQDRKSMTYHRLVFVNLELWQDDTFRIIEFRHVTCVVRPSCIYVQFLKNCIM